MENGYLENLFNPKSIAVIGASNQEHSVGMKLFKNLIQGGFEGTLYPVNPKHKDVLGHPCFSSVEDIKAAIDLAVIATPAQTVPDIIKACGKKGIRAAIIISAGFSEAGLKGKKIEQSFLEAARQYHVRLIGPNCLGVMRTPIHLNATFDNNTAAPGKLALVSQSGALCSAILDWSVEKKIGFSTLVSLGNSADLGFGEILDFLALDEKTESILLYIEGIKNARQFMSGLRAAARMKPVIVIKAGRHMQGSRAAHTHTGALVGDDDVFDAAMRRAGVVRVITLEQLFSAAQILASGYQLNGNRLAVITNGGGAGVMAADRAAELNVTLPQLSDSTFSALNKVLPEEWSHQNPVDIIGDAPPERYHAALQACARDDQVDGILSILIPVAMVQPIKVAEQIIKDVKEIKKPVLTCWMGQHHVASSWDLFAQHQIPCFDTPEDGVEAFSYLSSYYINQQSLLQLSDSEPYQELADIDRATRVLRYAFDEQRTVLTTTESKAVLNAFLIPTNQTVRAHTAEEAVRAADLLGFPVVMKIDSPDITHKQEVGGVQLNLVDEENVRHAFEQIMQQVKTMRPEAKILGVTLERMNRDENNRELMVGIVRDKVFGPAISFGAGGSLVEIMGDHTVALPPLNEFLAKKMIFRTKISKALEKFRQMPPVNLEAVIDVLLKVSEMICKFPQIQEMDINPLIANDREVSAVDARIVIDSRWPSSQLPPYSHLSICPYPSEWISKVRLQDGTNVLIRPVKPEDAQLQQNFIQSLSDKDRYFYFIDKVQELTTDKITRFTQIDYDREMVLIAVQGKNQTIGMAHYIARSDHSFCEFGLIIPEKWKNRGLEEKFMNSLIEIARIKGLHSMLGTVNAADENLLALLEKLNFVVLKTQDPTIKKVARDLNVNVEETFITTT